MRDRKTTFTLLIAASGTALMAFAPTGPPATNPDPPADAAPVANHKYNVTDKKTYLTAWRDAYPDSTLLTRMDRVAGESCVLCHEPSAKGDEGNCYRTDLLKQLDAGLSIAEAINAIDGFDSDGDGTPNGVEILMDRPDLPGEIGYNPGLIGETGTSPCSTSPSTAITSQRETPPCYADCDTSTGNGVLDIFDFLCFQNSFVAGEPYACDCDTSTGPGTCDIFDFLCFQNAFVAGCS